MKQQDVKVWMKVKPHSKTPDGRVNGLENSVVWQKAQERGQDWLYIASKRPNGDYPECLLALDWHGDKLISDYFLCEDFEKYSQ